MKKPFISATMHGYLDYLAAFGLLLFPVVLGLQEHSTLVFWMSIVSGVGLILYSVLTDYRRGLFRILPYSAHLGLDVAAASAFVIVGFAHQGDTLSQGYCWVMAAGVVLVVILSLVGKDCRRESCA